MVHNLEDRELWRRQGEEYLRKVRSKPPVHPLIAVARWTQAEDRRRNVRPAA